MYWSELEGIESLSNETAGQKVRELGGEADRYVKAKIMDRSVERFHHEGEGGMCGCIQSSHGIEGGCVCFN